MFDLFRSRDKAVRYLLGGLLLLVAASMVITLIPGYGSSAGSTRDDTTLAEVAGTKITERDIRLQIQRITRTGQLPPEMIEVYVPQFIEGNITSHAAVFEAERMGLKVSDDEVLTALMGSYPSFFPNGTLASREQFELALRQQGRTVDEEVEGMRQALLMKKLDNVMLAGVVVTPQEVDAELTRKHEKAAVAYVAFPAAKFRGEVKPTDDEILAYYNTHRQEFMKPESRAFQVLVVDQAKVEQSIVPTEAQLRAAYSASMDSFRTPERVHVRHILVSTEKKPDAEKKQLLTKAEDLLKQVKSGADFAALAKQHSEDPGSKDKGGEYWVVRGQMVPEFEKASFSLKPNESTVVTTQFGYHVLQVMEKENARVQPFEEVKAKLAEDLRKQQVGEKVQQLADQARAELLKNPEGATEIGQKLGIEVVTVTKGSPGEAIPVLGQTPEIDAAINSLQPKQASQVLVLPSNRLGVVVLNSRTPGRPFEFAETKDKVRDSLAAQRADLVADQKAKEFADKVRAGEDFEKLAKSWKLEVVTPPEFGHTDAIEGLGTAAYMEDAFAKPVGTVIGPTKIQGRQIVAKSVAKKAADLSAVGAERDQIRDKIRQQKSTLREEMMRDSILSKLTAEGKVKVNREAIKKFTSSFRASK